MPEPPGESDTPDLLFNRACAAERAGNTQDATKLYRQVLIANPAHGPANLNLGYLLLTKGNAPGAIACLQRSLHAPPTRETEDTAVPSFSPEALIGTNAEAPCFLLGTLLQEKARFEDAKACFERALQLNPRNGAAYYALVTAGGANEESMQTAYNDPNVGPNDRGPLCFALAKAVTERGDIQRAMALYDEGNQIAREQGPPFDRQDFQRSIDWMIKTYTPTRIRQLSQNGNPSELPLLIVGMMRSGTTLVEQILSSHPNIAAGGELVFWRDTLSPALRPGSPLPRTEALATKYLQLLREIGPDKARVTDKMPQNFAVLGLIHAIFPNARIVCCRRDPAETCVSIYTTSFRNPMPFTNSLEDIAFFHRQFDRLMAHWAQAIPPERLLDIQYEQLTADPEPTTRKLIKHSGLDWDDACLHPEQNTRSVKTASVWQVRQPVRSKSQTRFQPWLEEVRRLVT